jgi:hypothetical protein
LLEDFRNRLLRPQSRSFSISGVAESLGGELYALLRRTLMGVAAAAGIVFLASLLAPGHGTADAAGSEGQPDPAAGEAPAFRFVAVWPITATPASPVAAAPTEVIPPAAVAHIAAVVEPAPTAVTAFTPVAASDAVAPVPAESVLRGVLPADRHDGGLSADPNDVGVSADPNDVARAAVRRAAPPVVHNDGWAAARGTAGPDHSSGSRPVDAVERLASPAISTTSVGSLLSGSTPDAGPSPAQLAVLSAALLAVLWTTQRLRTSAHIWRSVLIKTRTARPG